MISTTAEAKESPSNRADISIPRYIGEVVYLFAFDVAYEMRRETIGTLLGQPALQFSIDASKRTPKQAIFYRPQMIHLPREERIGPCGRMPVQKTLKVLPIGAISITVRIPFSVASLDKLVAFHDLHFGNIALQAEVRELADKARAELEPLFVRPVTHMAEEEAYTVFCIDSSFLGKEGLSAEAWLERHRREVASLLAQEADAKKLALLEAQESTGRYLSYYGDDLIVIDWDAALVLDEPPEFSESLYIMELANMQLAELEAYDRLLDASLDRAYRDLRPRRLKRRRNVLGQLRELRIDLSRLSDELSNITKFFGDWHLARIYQTISSRFHLSDWHHSIDEKLKTLGDFYQLLAQDRINAWMLLLESTIVLLFIIDLALLVLGVIKP